MLTRNNAEDKRFSLNFKVIVDECAFSEVLEYNFSSHYLPGMQKDVKKT